MRILIVEDDSDFRGLLAEGLRQRGLVVVEAGGRVEALRALERAHFDFVLCDRHMPDGHGEEVARQTSQSSRFIYLTGDASEAGPHTILEKPVTLDQIMAALGTGGDTAEPGVQGLSRA